MGIEGAINWRRTDKSRDIIFQICSVASLGLLPLFCFQYPNFYYILTTIECHPEVASFVFFKSEGRSISSKLTHYQTPGMNEHCIVIEFECVRYCASNYDHYRFKRIPQVPENFQRFLNNQYRETYDLKRLTHEREILRYLYGLNKMEIPETSSFKIALRHIISPFYLFQYFAAAVWFAEDYWLYAILILIITFSAIYFTTREEVFNLANLRELAGSHSSIQLYTQESNGKFSLTVKSDYNLIPGDQFIISENMVLPCDAILIKGKVVVDESMLTGESIPVNKVSMEKKYIQNVSETMSPITSCRIPENEFEDPFSLLTGSILFGGTKVKATYGEQCLAIAYKTSFRSSKGHLVASLLKPKEGLIIFIVDALWVLLLMVLLSTTLYGLVSYELWSLGATAGEIILHYLDAITIAVPPALTACLTVSTALAMDRLKKVNIFVSDTSRVNFAGSITAVSFDKTGTLTENSLKFIGALISEELKLSEYEATEEKPVNIPYICQLLMATCHSLSLYGLDQSNIPMGDPLEVELFCSSKWKLSQLEGTGGHLIAFPSINEKSDYYDILKHFEFTPEKLRAASLVREPKAKGSRLLYLLKGSPEIIIQLSCPNSLPTDLKERLNSLGRCGYRVIAAAYKICPETDINCTQEEIEGGGALIFLGLLYLSSSLKAETIKTIDSLHEASIHCNMITGDHVHTAIAVAKDCGILSHQSKKCASHIERGFSGDVYIIDGDEAGNIIIIDSKTDEILDLEVTDVLNTFVKSINRNSNSSLILQTSNPLFERYDEKENLELALTGKGLHALKSSLTLPQSTLPVLLRFAKVFARMKPLDKKFIVQTLMQPLITWSLHDSTDDSESADSSTQLTSVSQSAANKIRQSISPLSQKDNEATDNNTLDVMFCGDGANDMLALRTATVGVSLCDAETSVAAPVTSKLQSPYAVINVLIEGRCSLVTAFVLILFNILYGVIQLFMACELYAFGLLVGNYMYLVQDLFFTLLLGLAISYTPPTGILSKQIPPTRFLSKFFIVKLIFLITNIILFQAITIWLLSIQSFYDRYETDDPLSGTYSYEASAINDMALGQLMIASVVSTIGEPFRLEWYRNYYHVGLLVGQSCWLLFQIFSQKNYFLQEILQIKPLPVSFGFVILALLLINLLFSIGISRICDQKFLFLTTPSRFTFTFRDLTEIFDFSNPLKQYYNIQNPHEPDAHEEFLDQEQNILFRSPIGENLSA